MPRTHTAGATLGTPAPFSLRLGERTRIAGIAILALLVRLLTLRADLVLVDDELHYAESLARFLRGDVLGGVSDYWSFLYPLAAIPLAAVSGDAETGLRLLSIFAGAALTVPAYLIARRLWSPAAAAFSALFVALHPMLVQFSAMAMTESFYMFLLFLSVLFFLEALAGGKARHQALAAAMIGLAWLTRQEAQFVFAIFLGVWLLAPGAGSAPRPFAARVRGAAMMLAIFVVAASPYIVLLRAKTGRWTTGAKASVNISSPLLWQEGLAKEEYLYRLNAEGTRRALDDVKAQSPIRVLWENRRNVAARYPDNLTAGLGLMPALLSSPLLVLLVPFGMIGRRWSRARRSEEITLFLLGIFPIALFSFFTVGLRYFVSYLPVYLLWAGAGCWQLVTWWRESISPRTRPAVIVIALAYLSLLPYIAHKQRVLWEAQPHENRTIGRWIREHEGPGKRILAKSGSSISYYAGNAEATFIPWTDAPGLLRFARHHGYELLALHEFYVYKNRPLLVGMLDGTDGLEMITTFSTRSGDNVILYRIESSADAPRHEIGGRP